MDKKDLISFRTYTPEDYNFILATWLRGLYYGNDWFKKIPKQVFMDNYHKVIDKILSRPQIKSKIATLKEDPGVILGYSIYEGHTLHWVFVKQVWRKIGLAKSLVPGDTSQTTHMTKIGYKLKGEIDFNPFL